MSSLLLETNERISSLNRAKHIKAKYFLIKDYYDSGEIDLRYCPTDVMWVNILTKPLQAAGAEVYGHASVSPELST